MRHRRLVHRGSGCATAPVSRTDIKGAIAWACSASTCFELCPSPYLQTGTFSSLAPVCDVIRWLDDADVPYCLTTDNPAFNGRYLQAEYELDLEYDLIDFQRLGRCRWNTFAYAL
jgi:adenosine deaminase